MQRHRIEPRPDWQRIVEEQGLIYPLTRFPDDSLRPYWDESAYYSFGPAEVEALEDTVAELHAMCLAAAAHIVEHNRFRDLGITDQVVAATVRGSWRRRDEQPSVYGRFDLRYDGNGPAKLLEYNADTPTSLVEAASPQWFWMEDRFPGADQWGFAQFNYDNASQSFSPLGKGPNCGTACHQAAASRDFVFTEYPTR